MTNLLYQNVKLVWSANIANIQHTPTKRTSVVGQIDTTERLPNDNDNNFNDNDHMNLHHKSTKTPRPHIAYSQTEKNSVRTENDKLLKLTQTERPVPTPLTQHRCHKHSRML